MLLIFFSARPPKAFFFSVFLSWLVSPAIMWLASPVRPGLEAPSELEGGAAALSESPLPLLQWCRFFRRGTAFSPPLRSREVVRPALSPLYLALPPFSATVVRSGLLPL